LARAAVERAPTSCLAGAEVPMHPAGWVGKPGIPSSLVCIDNARVAMRFPRTSERPRDRRRCHTSAGGKCDTGTRAASVGRLSRPAGALDARQRSPRRGGQEQPRRGARSPGLCRATCWMDRERGARGPSKLCARQRPEQRLSSKGREVVAPKGCSASTEAARRREATRQREAPRRETGGDPRRMSR
jgi:hypothetical protein